MKKKISRQQHVSKLEPFPSVQCKICKSISSKKKNNSLFQINYQLIAHTINQTMQKATFLSTINKIFQRNFSHNQSGQPSKQSITYQQVQKNLVFQQYLKQYYPIHKIPDKIMRLLPKHIPNVKANYMDFKIKNFLILNKYRIVEKPPLPYPLCTKFQKLTDSKMSSTKSVQNKVLQQLEKESRQKQTIKGHNLVRNSKQRYKKINKSKKLTTQNFQIKTLAKGIEQMIQNIKDTRALQSFKKQMEKSTQFKYGILKNTVNENNQPKKHSQKSKGLNSEKNQIQLHQLKEKEFKRKIEDDMTRYFPDLKKKSPCLIKKTNIMDHYNLPLSKNSSKQKFNFRSTQRLQTNADHQFQEYGLSVIREKRKKSRSTKKKSKSRQHSKKSKQSSANFHSSKSKRLETEYVDSSSQRLNTAQSNLTLTKHKSSSRIPTEYDSDIIIKSKKSKSKSKNQHFLFTNLSKKQSKSSSLSSQNAQLGHNFKKSKSKSKLNLLQFNSSSKALHN